MKVERVYRKLGAQLKDRRIAAKRSQLWMADKLNIGRSSVANFERGRQRLPLHVIMDAARALRVKFTDLWG